MIPHDWVGNWLWNKRHLTDFRMAQLIMWALLACCLDTLLRLNMHTSDTWIHLGTQESCMWWRAGGRIPDQLEDEEFWKPTDKDQKIEKLTGPPDGTFYTKWIYWRGSFAVWTVDVSSLEGIDSVYIKMGIGVLSQCRRLLWGVSEQEATVVLSLSLWCWAILWWDCWPVVFSLCCCVAFSCGLNI